MKSEEESEEVRKKIPFPELAYQRILKNIAKNLRKQKLCVYYQNRKILFISIYYISMHGTGLHHLSVQQLVRKKAKKMAKRIANKKIKAALQEA